MAGNRRGAEVPGLVSQVVSICFSSGHSSVGHKCCGVRCCWLLLAFQALYTSPHLMFQACTSLTEQSTLRYKTYTRGRKALRG